MGNLREGTPGGIARRLYRNACAVIDQARESDREPLRELLPDAQSISEQAYRLMF